MSGQKTKGNKERSTIRTYKVARGLNEEPVYILPVCCMCYLGMLSWLAGLGLIIAGAVVQSELSTYFDFFGGSVSAAAILLIVVGVIIFIIGFFGCCGAYKENYCMVMTFAFLLGLVFILEISAGIAAYVMRDQVEDMIQEKMRDSMTNFNKDGYEGVTKAWTTVQRDFKCCGVDEPSDWKNVTEFAPDNVPDSCCITETTGCGTDKTAPKYDKGCINGFVEWVKGNIYVVGGLGIGLAFIQIFGIILACCLARTIKKEYEVV